jgi:hypothetical protein
MTAKQHGIILISIGVETENRDLKNPSQRRGAGSSILGKCCRQAASRAFQIILLGFPCHCQLKHSLPKPALSGRPACRVEQKFGKCNRASSVAGFELDEAKRGLRLRRSLPIVGAGARRENRPVAIATLVAADRAKGLPFRPRLRPGVQIAADRP